jgi:hypothetical protein
MTIDIVKAILTKLFDYGYSEADIDKMAERFDIAGLTESQVVATLNITWPELRRWRSDGRFPEPNILTFAWEWKSGGRYKRLTDVAGWSFEAIEAVRPNIEAWRAEHKANRKIKQQTNRQLV